jgi:hypothetical protein
MQVEVIPTVLESCKSMILTTKYFGHIYIYNNNFKSYI